MKCLDLHGIKHEDVSFLVENFVIMEQCPFEIITGNSFIMQKIVKSILDKYHFKYTYQSYINLGSLIVFDY